MCVSYASEPRVPSTVLVTNDTTYIPGEEHIRGVFKKRPNFLNSAPTITESALRPLSAPSVRFWQQTAICPVSLWALVVELRPLKWARAQAVRRISDKEEIQENAIRQLRAITESAFQEAFQQWKKRWNGVSPIEGTTLKGTVLKML
jgi:hypothetical protein